MIFARSPKNKFAALLVYSVYTLYICLMKKLIDIPDDILVDLKILAAKANMPLKNFIQKVLTDLVKKSKKK